MSTVTCMSIYGLILFTLAYLLNQLDRYMLAITARPLAQALKYGDQACLSNATAAHSAVCNATTQDQCLAISTVNESSPCDWNYNGQGYEYQVLAGPVFIVVFTFVGIPVGFAADAYRSRRVWFLGGAVAFWSLMSLLTGFVQQYWQLALTRFMLGVGEAGCTPFATSLIADMFDVRHRASALGVYNLGIYTGYSMSYAIGNFITNSYGWRWAFYISGIPGLILGPLIFFSVKQPSQPVESQVNKDKENGESDKDSEAEDEESPLLSSTPEVAVSESPAKLIARTFCQPTLIMLCLAGSIRNAAGYIWAYNTQPYYENIGEAPTTIGLYMSWIPLAAGSVGVILGGVISDQVVKKIGPKARLLVLVVSQLLAAPFVAGALFLQPPYAYYSLIPGYIIGEMWVGITLAVAVEVIPPQLRTAAVAVYLFIITNIGGNMPLLVPPLQTAFKNNGYTDVEALRGALYILYPGMYVLAAFLFLLTLCLLHRDIRKRNTAMDH